jgi:hypothetical protein
MITPRQILSPAQRKRIIAMKLAGAYSGDIRDKLGVTSANITNAWAEYRSENPDTAGVPTGRHSKRKAAK